MSFKKKLVVAAATTGLAMSGVLIGVTDASAIRRAGCNEQNVEIFSGNSACFAFEGGMNVKLYRTVGAKGGINTGFVKKSNGQFQNYPRGSITWPKIDVTFVAINRR